MTTCQRTAIYLFVRTRDQKRSTKGPKAHICQSALRQTFLISEKNVIRLVKKVPTGLLKCRFGMNTCQIIKCLSQIFFDFVYSVQHTLSRAIFTLRIIYSSFVVSLRKYKLTIGTFIFFSIKRYCIIMWSSLQREFLCFQCISFVSFYVLS